MRTPTPLLLRLCCYFCLAQVCFSLSQQRNLPTTNFDGGPVVNLVYFCTLRQTSGKTCEETAVSIYSMSLMLSPQRSITDTRDIHVSVVSNAECRSCLAPKIEALQETLDPRISVRFFLLDELQDLIPSFKSKASVVQATYPALFPRIQFMAAIDADTLFSDDVRVLWDEFGRFNSTQMFGIAEEQDTLYSLSATRGGYYTKGLGGQVPFVQPYGINSGVVLFDCKKFRASDFVAKLTSEIEDRGIEVFRNRKAALPIRDQDLFNLYCSLKPETLYRLPCRWNMRTDSMCKSENAGIQHGSRSTFAMSDRFPGWHKVHDHIANFTSTTPAQEQSMREEVLRTRAWVTKQHYPWP